MYFVNIDGCLRIIATGVGYVHILPGPDATDPTVADGYVPLPLATVRAWIDNTGER